MIDTPVQLLLPNIVSSKKKKENNLQWQNTVGRRLGEIRVVFLNVVMPKD